MIFRVGIIESRKPREKGHDFQYRYGLDTLCEYRVCVTYSRRVYARNLYPFLAPTFGISRRVLGRIPV